MYCFPLQVHARVRAWWSTMVKVRICLAIISLLSLSFVAYRSLRTIRVYGWCLCCVVTSTPLRFSVLLLVRILCVYGGCCVPLVFPWQAPAVMVLAFPVPVGDIFVLSVRVCICFDLPECVGSHVHLPLSLQVCPPCR